MLSVLFLQLWLLLGDFYRDAGSIIPISVSASYQDNTQPNANGNKDAMVVV